MKKRYFLFEIWSYYPTGGLDDITDSFDDLDSAMKALSESRSDLNYILDREEWKVYENGEWKVCENGEWKNANLG